MKGMNRNTGKVLAGADHIRQSVVDILTTPLGTRVMLPEYGSNLADLVDNPNDPALAIKIIMASAGALARWEPRVRVDRVRPVTINASTGLIAIDITATDVETRKRLELNNLELPFK